MGLAPITDPVAGFGHPFMLRPKETSAETEYYAAFGRFIATYARAEAAVNMAARHFSTLDDDLARVIFGGMRLTDLAEKIRKMMPANQTVSKDIDACLTQLDLISKERDKLVHRRVKYEPTKGLTVTNILTAKIVINYEEVSFTRDMLEDLEGDCRSIYLRLFLKMEFPSDLELRDPTLLSLYDAWRYKPLPPKRKKKPHRATARSRRHQRRASRE